MLTELPAKRRECVRLELPSAAASKMAATAAELRDLFKQADSLEGLMDMAMRAAAAGGGAGGGDPNVRCPSACDKNTTQRNPHSTGIPSLQ